MAARLGNVLYWIGCIVAALILLYDGVLLSLEEPTQLARDFSVFVFIAIAALVVWLIGRACRYVLSGR
jgi:hypothetical protein